MKKIMLMVLVIFLASINTQAASTDTTMTEEEALQVFEARNKQIKYQTGQVDINSEIQLNIPQGYKFMPKSDAEYVIFDMWGNPHQDDILGMVVKEDYSISDMDKWTFVVSYENSGYVKDEDADKIDYEELMQNIQESEADENKQRKEEGYPSIHILGWATKPFYDKENNILHWAKSIKFGDGMSDTTLNYDVRILGRKGVLSMNAVGVLSQLEDIKVHIPQIIHIASFKKGSSYLDFDPKVDKVAAYTIGGLVAGKLLAKAGIIALLLKNIKLILLGVFGLFGGFGKKILGFFKKNKEEEYTIPNSNETQSTDTKIPD